MPYTSPDATPRRRAGPRSPRLPHRLHFSAEIQPDKPSSPPLGFYQRPRLFRVIHMFRIALVMSLLLLSAQAGAKTIRYEFNVVSSIIDYQILEADQVVGPEEYAAFTAAYHALGGALGLSGHVTLEVVEQDGRDKEADLFCVSGFLCDSDAFQRSEVRNYSESSGFSAIPPGYEWTLSVSPSGSGNLFFYDDYAFIGGEFLDDVLYVWRSPYATFFLENLNISVIPTTPNPVPLPATALFLGLGLVVLALTARPRTT